ncbi:hypothetical protein D3W54_14755 [Komagataeibacter medellinensis]|uniref:Uncharacterized protein n=1 Tax=Komagataeibacter medellinensis TaxID=1177712 RepID=A0ABQ6VR80_9PROT|nr:hypothetical protein [Komagataeibacter medellinensis]KAB8122448.1 hypothetical protein D3W54_14755 [Komagataeibacter medellinensis]
MRRYPRTLMHPDGYTTVTVQDADEEARVRARFAGHPEPSRRDAPQPTITRRRGRPPNVRNSQ